MGDVIIDGTVGANRLLILDANGKIPAVDGSAVTNVAGANFSTGTIPVARIDTGTTANKVVKLDGNAKLPAVSGAAITGVESATKNASDPTPSTNPSGGVGTEWINTTTGEVYICTNATAGANVWTNVGGLTGDINPWGRPWGGTAYGYQAGGYILSPAGPINVIQKYSFTSDGNATDVGDLTWATDGNACHSSTTYGYCATGDHPVTTNINKWSFSSDGNAVAYGGAVVGGGWGTSGSYSTTHGYTWGRNNSGPYHNLIDKFSFEAEANATDVGDMTVAGSYHAAASTLSLIHI